MKKFQFKTNINCSGCVAKVTPHLDGEPAVSEWKVDTANPDKILTVETEKLNEAQVRSIIQNAGFKADTLS